MGKEYFAVYMLANRYRGTIYIGMTSNLPKRIWEHKEKVVEGFTEKYDVNILVYYELHGSAEQGIRRERRLKEWQRQWKIELIEKQNPDWKDLYEEVIA